MADDLGLPDRWMIVASTPCNVVADTGGTITVATVEELVTMKMAAGRAQDLADLRILARHLCITHPETARRDRIRPLRRGLARLGDPRESYELFARDVLVDRRRR
ncbi:hypothetical protein [Agromyces sp. M3QZ16-3]|uniref:hypothetical protein n=1 Tax=Agromyces sp. M3QZ16-3 TaxID=3447585 RepID=UPI003F68C83A